MLLTEPQREPARTPEKVSPAMAEALREMLARHDTVAEDMAHARKVVEEKRAEAAELSVAIDRIARLLPPATRRGIMMRLANSQARTKARPGARRASDPGGRIAAIKRWLVAQDPDRFSTVELTAHLEREGFKLPPKYAANACRELEGQGMLHRLTRGTYALNRVHPEICDLILENLDRQIRAL